MSAYELLVGSGPFWERASADIAAARSRVFIQAMTFEADGAGSAVAAAVEASRAVDRRVLVDDYSRHVINDRFLVLPQNRLEPGLHVEARATRAMFAGLVSNGIGVRVTNPIRGNVARYGIRNHKKLIVADDVAYIGGFNFSDHNFAWHDLMLRIEDPQAAAFLASDFEATWNGPIVARQAAIGGLRLYALGGRDNAASFADLFAAIAGARERIELVSAYPTFPFLEALGEAVARGISVEIFTPLPNNKPMVRDYLVDRAPRLGITLRLLPEMTHLKGMLIDGRTLALGSTNFDFASFHGAEEYLAILDDPGLIEAFRREVLAPARASALPDGCYRPPRWHLAWSRFVLWMGKTSVKAMRRAPREAVDWR